MNYNERTVTIKLRRIDICDLLIVCTCAGETSESKKWEELHEKLLKQLDEFDEKNGYGVMKQ